MVIDALPALTVLLLTAVIGFPSALLLTRAWRELDWGELLVAAFTIGVLAEVLIGLVLGHSAFYRAPVLVAALLAFAGTSGAIAFRARRTLRMSPPDTVSAVVIVMAAAGAVLAGSTSYFVFQTGDMGAYVNSANVAANGTGLGGGFPHGFTAWLGNANLLTGQANMVDAAMGSLAALFVLTTAVLARSLTRSAAAAIAVAALALVHPTARWFSSIPVSESLFAVMLACALLLLWKARRAGDVATAIVGGSCLSSLLLIRANALVLSGVVVAAAFASALLDGRSVRRAQLAFNVSATVGLVLCYAYNVEFVPSYFIRLQLEVELPPAVFDALETLDLLAVGPALALAGGVAVGAVAAIARLGPSDGNEARIAPRWSTPMAAIVVVAIAAAATALLGTESVGDAFVRWHVLVLVPACAGVVVVALGRSWTDPVMTLVLLASGAMGVVLFAARLDEPLSHAYYLYWDRYLFGDSFLVALVLAGVAVAACASGVARIGARYGRLAGGSAGVFLLVALMAASVPAIDESLRIERHELLGDSYGALEAIADAVPADRSEPIVYSGPPAPPDGWFFPNLFRAYALPLRQTFERPVVNFPADPFTTDPQATVGQARAFVTRTGASRGFLLRVRSSADSSPLVGTGATLLRTVHHPVWLLPRSLDPGSERYRRVDIVLELYRIEALDLQTRRSADAYGE